MSSDISATIELDLTKDHNLIIQPIFSDCCIKRCLQSLLWQHYESLEIIMVDDNSTDDTLDIAKTIKDRRLKLVTLKRTPPGWTGKSWASQVGYLASNGKILLFTDADTFY
jgi:glycosyltransferase involved in cell wall biosynthesis